MCLRLKYLLGLFQLPMDKDIINSQREKHDILQYQLLITQSMFIQMKIIFKHLNK